MNSATIIVPTLNEAENIQELLLRIADACQSSSYSIEVVLVDDASTDGTREIAQANQSGLQLKILHRTDKRGLASAIVDGAAIASGDIAVVMDADLSHPPVTIPKLIDALAKDGWDMAIGSRHVPGGSIPCWPWYRRVVSRVAQFLAWPFSEAKDPLSGFFAVRTDLLKNLKSRVAGFKIGLEILSEHVDTIKVVEVPIEFHDRRWGKSKLSSRVIREYLAQLLFLAGANIPNAAKFRFILSFLSGLAMDVSIFHLLFSGSLASLAPAHISGFLAATLVSFSLYRPWSFSKISGTVSPSIQRQTLSFIVIVLLAVFLRGGVLEFFVQVCSWTPRSAIWPTIFAGSAVNFIGWTFLGPDKFSGNRSAMEWRLLSLFVVTYALLLRLFYIGSVELIHEEAYYWNYAQHLDIGYLDHPPAVAWIIRLGVSVFGDTEFGVRIGAFCCWLATAFFSYRLARRIFNKTTAFRALLLVAALPIFFGIGVTMSPDAPLVACWSGALYFLYRALIDKRSRAWIAAGIFLGLGMLSKYTIALLGPAIIVFLAIDPESRKWFAKPTPYLAAFVALILFSPVLVWNYNNEWASFFFQGPRRVMGGLNFSTQQLLVGILLLITPTGFIAFLSVLFLRKKFFHASIGSLPEAQYRSYTFAIVFLTVPLSVFFLFSLIKGVKINWTGPIWLSIIPFMAHYMPSAFSGTSRFFSWLFRYLPRMWPATVVILLLLYGGSLHYLTLGFVGVPYIQNFYPGGYRDLGSQIELLEDEIEADSGMEPLVVGMDKYKTASLLSFYRPEIPSETIDTGGRESLLYTTGCHMFGGNSLMFQYWAPEKIHDKQILILVSPNRSKLMNNLIRSAVDKIDPVQKIILRHNGIPVGEYYYAVAYNYRGGSPPT